MSAPDFENLPTRLGVYKLTELLGRDNLTNFYMANQSHVERGVVLQVLHPNSSQEAVDYFLQAARARGMATLPGVSQVLESRLTGDVWYIAHERPRGRHLAQFAEEGQTLSTNQACAVISAVAAMCLAAQQQNIALEPSLAYTIFVDKKNRVSILSPVLPGEYMPEQCVACMQNLADVLQPIMPRNVAGQGRVATLVQWIREGFEGEYLDWKTIAATAQEIQRQTAPVLTRAAVENLNSQTVIRQVKEKEEQRKHRRNMLLLAVAALLVICMGVAGGLWLHFEQDALPPREGNFVYVQTEQGPRRVLSRPISIIEYQRFLNRYEDPNALNEARRERINAGVPEDCANHTPAEWQEQLRAVDSGEEWHGEKLTSRSPVRGISYWDALAYANYVEATLPSAAVLEAVREHVEAENLPEEWTTTVTASDKLYMAGTVVLTASPASHPIVEPNRATRSVKRGFRITLPPSR